VPNKSPEIYCKRFFLEPPEEFTYVGGRAAAVSSDERRNAHSNKILRGWIVENVLRMSMNVDEARCDDLILRVDHIFGLGLIESPNFRDPSIFDRN